MKAHYIVDKAGEATLVEPSPQGLFPRFNGLGKVSLASLMELAARQGVPVYRWDGKKCAHVDLAHNSTASCLSGVRS